LSTDPAALSLVARNVIAHYQAASHLLPVDTRPDINARWLEDTSSRSIDVGMLAPSLTRER